MITSSIYGYEVYFPQYEGWDPVLSWQVTDASADINFS